MVRKPKVHFPWSVAFFFVRTQWLLCWTFSGRRRRLTPPPSSFPPSMPVILHAGRVSDKRLDHERCSRPDTANIGLQRPMCLLLCFSPRTAAMWPFISFLLFLSLFIQAVGDDVENLIRRFSSRPWRTLCCTILQRTAHQMYPALVTLANRLIA